MPSNRRGFTLVELLIVVVIIGILSAIAIPQFRDAKRRDAEYEMSYALKKVVNEANDWYVENHTFKHYIAHSGRFADVAIKFYPDDYGWHATASHRHTKTMCIAFDVAGSNLFPEPVCGIQPSAALDSVVVLRSALK